MVTPLQLKIIEELKVKPAIDAAQEIRTRVDFLKDYLLGSGQNGFCLGISGGQDSALVGKLCALACEELTAESGKDYKFVALLLPYGEQRDILDAEAVAYDFIQSTSVIKFNIKDSVDAMEVEFNRHKDTPNLDVGALEDFHRGGIKCRARMAVQYAYAGQTKLLVAGCTHSAEVINGYEFKGGDSMCDISPIFGLNKRQGKELLRLLDAPDFLFTKNPTADLLDSNPQQADEDELGISYNSIDNFLEGLDVTPEEAALLEGRFLRAAHKRYMPVTPYDNWYKEEIYT
jgi:NAD+ synthase